ncbi:MAG TPA: response regulator [Desulfopila sp.]|nr:response regulator [Desulfopila sp.]
MSIGSEAVFKLPHHLYYEEKMDTENRADATNTSGTGTILLIDDEPEVLRVMAIRLERMGHRVVSTTDSREALQMIRKDPEEYDLVLTDQAMPQISGDQLAQKIIALRPDMPLILCTGFSYSIDEHEARRMGFEALLAKPILGADLTAVVSRCLLQRPVH